MTTEAAVEDRFGVLYMDVVACGDEQIGVGREGLLYSCRMHGVLRDDIGVEGLAGAPVSISLRGYRDFPLEEGLDQIHGLRQGSAIGVVALISPGVHIAASLDWQVVESLRALVARGMGRKDVRLEARFATGRLRRRRNLEPRDLHEMPERRAALTYFAVDGPRLPRADRRRREG